MARAYQPALVGEYDGLYVFQAMVPAIAGCIAGSALGHLLAAALLARTASAYGVGTLGMPLWTDAAVPLAMCSLTGIAALVLAVRAGRLNAVEAIAARRARRSPWPPCCSARQR